MALNSGQCAEKTCLLQLEPVEQTTESGYYDLEWGLASESTTDKSDSSNQNNNSASNNDIAVATTLEISNDKTFNNISHKINISYQDTIHLTGFSNGRYYIRLLDDSGERVSNIAQVGVEHHSMNRVWTIFTLGAILFVLLVGYMIAKAFRNQDD